MLLIKDGGYHCPSTPSAVLWYSIVASSPSYRYIRIANWTEPLVLSAGSHFAGLGIPTPAAPAGCPGRTFPPRLFRRQYRTAPLIPSGRRSRLPRAPWVPTAPAHRPVPTTPGRRRGKWPELRRRPRRDKGELSASQLDELQEKNLAKRGPVHSGCSLGKQE